MTLRLDGRAVEGQGTVLDICRAEGVFVPTFCHDDRTTKGGHCRACLVEIDGRLAPACTTTAPPGANVETDTERLRAYRRDLGELMSAEATPGGSVAAVLEGFGVTGERYAKTPRFDDRRRDESHPYLRFRLDACILCRLCVRVCSEIQGQFVYAVEGRGAAAALTFGEGAFAASDCVSCGACAQACPSGAISDIDRDAPLPAEPLVEVKTTCSYCGVGCNLLVQVAGDRVHHIDGAESPVNHGHTCVKGRYAHTFARHPDRLRTPLVRKDGAFVAASWDEALALIAREFKARPGKVAGLSSSRCTNEENYLFQKLMRVALGTNDVDCCARVCHAPSAAGMRASFGTGAATNSLADIESADLLFVSGSNTTESHPVTGSRVKQAVLGGATLIVVDPRRTELAAMADIHLAPKPGTNVPLLNGLAAVIVEEGLVSKAFIESRTEGFAEFAAFIRRYRPEDWAEVTGVAASRVRAAARAYAKAARPMQVHGLGMTEHLQGSEGVMLLCNLALLVGAVGREGVGVNPLRGQNNVQGAADMGCQPDLLTGYANPADAAVKARFEGVWGRALPGASGRTLPHMYEAIDSGDVTAMFILGEDVVQTDPDAGRVKDWLGKLEFLVVEEIFPSETSKYAHVILPGASFLEKDGTFTNGERRVQRVRKAIEPAGLARPDWRILCDLMAALGAPQPFASAEDVWNEVRQVAPAFAGASYAALDAAGVQWPAPAGHPEGTPILHTESFARGLGAFQRVEYTASPSLDLDKGELILMTGRVLEHYNSGSMTRRSKNVELEGRDYLEIHPSDAHARGIAAGDPVRVASDFGLARVTARLTDAVRRGTLFLSFHFPESGTNNVTTDVLDRLAGCPEYKVTAVTVERDR